MAQFQVVAVYESGNRYEILGTKENFLAAEDHRTHCELTADPADTWVYEVDMSYFGSDGQWHWRGNVTGESLGYSSEEVEDVRANVAARVARSRVA